MGWPSGASWSPPERTYRIGCDKNRCIVPGILSDAHVDGRTVHEFGMGYFNPQGRRIFVTE